MLRFRRIALVLVIAVVAIALALGAAYQYIASGGLIAVQRPSAAETKVAGWMLKLSVPETAKAMKNPLHGTDSGDGRRLYQQKCDVCHSYDGSGNTDIGSGLYPPPMDLRGPEVVKASDGELFYFIRNGIRNTAMPGWQMPDQDIWRLILFIRSLPKVAARVERSDQPGIPDSAQYVGSASCQSCHAAIYERWSRTLMANVVRDPRTHPDAIIPDLSKPEPLLTFTKDDIAFVYGTKWKQRYFKKVGDDYFPLPAQWDVSNRVWRAYNVKAGTDWWTLFYPDDNMSRPTGPTCDGCHSVNYDIATKKVTEWNVGCEKCHGPGSEHVRKPLVSNIVNPSRLNFVDATDTCIQCHSQGRPLTPPSAGKAYDWPVGFQMGQRLDRFWKLEESKPGETTFTHFADGTAHKNRMQGNDFVTSAMYTHGISCFTCHDSHGSGNDSLLRKPANVLCLDCHGPTSPRGPRGASVEAHTHHKAGSKGNECVSCHMPKIEQTLADVNVSSHTFRFIAPSATDSLKVPNACNMCHKDKSTKWASDALKSWGQFSSWRVANRL